MTTLDTTDTGRQAFVDAISCQVVGTFLSNGDHGASYTRVKLTNSYDCHRPGDIMDYPSQYVEYAL